MRTVASYNTAIKTLKVGARPSGARLPPGDPNATTTTTTTPQSARAKRRAKARAAKVDADKAAKAAAKASRVRRAAVRVVVG